MAESKDAYYFPHFCNARHDRKIKRVIKELGIEGYGIFFMLLEVLREQTDFKYPMDDIDLLADEFGTSEQKVRTVICNYQLFYVDDQQKFFSPKLLVYLQPYFKASEHARLAAKKRWGARALPEQCGSNANKVNESKVNESKEEQLQQEVVVVENNLQKIVKTWEKEFGLTISPATSEKLLAWAEQDGMMVELVEEAIKIAAGENKRNLSYIEGILKKWKDKKIINIAGVIAEKEQFKKTKETIQPKQVKSSTPPTAKCNDDFWQAVGQAEKQNE
jgi:DnaD/phage-associated family protein